MEDIVLFRNVALFHTPHVLDGIAPFLPVVRKVPELLSGGKFTQIYQKEGHFLRKNSVLVILQHHMLYKIATSFQFWDFEIGEDDGDDGRVVVFAVSFYERGTDDVFKFILLKINMLIWYILTKNRSVLDGETTNG